MATKLLKVGDIVEVDVPGRARLIVRVEQAATIAELAAVPGMDMTEVREAYESLGAVQALLCLYPALKPPRFVVSAIVQADGAIVCDHVVTPLSIEGSFILAPRRTAPCPN